MSLSTCICGGSLRPVDDHLECEDCGATAALRILDDPTHVFHYAAGLSGDHWLLVHHGRGGRP